MWKPAVQWTAAVLTSSVVAFTSAAAFPTALAGDECTGLTWIYNNYKIDIEWWPDEHGHEGGEGDPGGEWVYVHTHYSNEVGGENAHHSEFLDNGYANELHEICVPE